MTRSHRPHAALIISILALVVALVGGPLQGAATAAARLITGGDIKNGSITGTDIKNGSLGAGDLASSAKAQVYWADTAGNQQLSTPGLASVVSVSVPAGRYLVLGNTGVTNISGASRSAECRIFDGTNDLGRAKGLDDTTERSSYVAVTAFATLTSPGTLSLRCSATGSSVYTPNTTRPSVTAVRVGSVSNQTP